MNKEMFSFKTMTQFKLRSEMYSTFRNMAYTEIKRAR